jgi:hypothetical protein
MTSAAPRKSQESSGGGALAEALRRAAEKAEALRRAAEKNGRKGA